MRPVLFHIGDIAVSSFWTTAFLGFVFAFLLVRRDCIRRGYGVSLAYDMILYAYVGGWVGARLFLIPTAWEIFTTNPIGFLLSGSGWVWYGGVIGGGLAMTQVARQRGLSMLVLSDIAAPGLAMGLAIGRIGCQLSGDGDYGIPTNVPWCMSYPDGVVPTTECVHPTPIYEMLACWTLCAYLWHRGSQQTVATGDIFGRYLIASGVIRFLIETVRRNPAWFLGMTTAQAISIVMIVGGSLLLSQLRMVQDPERDAANRVAGGVGESHGS